MALRDNFLRLTFLILILPGFGSSHGLKPVSAEYSISNRILTLNLTTNVEALLSGMDASMFKNTEEAPEATYYNELRKLNNLELETRINNSSQMLESIFSVLAESELMEIRLSKVVVGENEDATEPRATKLFFEITLPDPANFFQISPKKILGPIVLRSILYNEKKEKINVSKWLEAGQLSEPIPIVIEKMSVLGTVSYSMFQGVQHIIPKGFDHILFVLGIFFFSYKVGPLLGQVTIFTLAHSIAFILASLGYITVSSLMVEAIIAASIIWIGVENLFRTKINKSRILVIFCFGLLHGLGFASMFIELGFDSSDYILNLLSFNVGIELAQLIVLFPLILMIPFFAKFAIYRAVIAIPSSVIIAAFGTKMFVERVI